MSITVDADMIREIKRQLAAQGRRTFLARLRTVEPALYQEIATSICDLWDALEEVHCSPERRREIHVQCANAILAPVEALWWTTRGALGAARAQARVEKLKAINTEAKLAELLHRSTRRGQIGGEQP